jgi:DNA-directed RNA polymerase specialized sigma24 family protein
MTDQLPFTGTSRSQAGIGIPVTRLGPFSAEAPVPAQRTGSRADEALAKIYEQQSGPLTRLAVLLVWAAARPAAVPPITQASPSTEARNIPVAGIGAIPDAIGEIAQEIVHDALAAMHREWHRLRDAERALAYLRRAIVHEARAHGRAARAGHDASAGDGKDAGLSAMSAVVLAALRRLPGRQREALVLRYYADLPEAAAADAMGVTRASFRGHAARGMTALRLLLDQGP